MLVINFAHPLTASQRARIEELARQPIDRVIDVETQFDPEGAFVDQARNLVDMAGLNSDQWQTTPLLINAPSLSPIACLLLVELHGRMGYFPTLLRLRPKPNANPPCFEVAELLNLQAMREAARRQR